MPSEPVRPPDRPESGRDRDATWSRYRDNLPRHLTGISRDLESRVMRSLARERGYRGLRPSFGPLLSLVWLQGRPLSGIAAQLGISKQACSQLASLAEQAGYLERRPDPADGRARLVLLTPRGRKLVEQAVWVILASESEYAQTVGPEPYGRFTDTLGRLYEGLGIPTHVDPALGSSASRSIGVLPLIVVRIQRLLMEATRARGHDGLKMSHAQVLPLIGPGGSRVHQIARVQRVSRQAISATARDLEALGYLRRDPDALDRRGVVLRLTDAGERLIRDCVAALDGVDASFRQILGGARLEQLCEVARELYQALHLEEEIFEARPEPQPGAVTDGEESEIRQLASALRRRLGRRDTARLAALLEPRTTGGTT